MHHKGMGAAALTTILTIGSGVVAPTPAPRRLGTYMVKNLQSVNGLYYGDFAALRRRPQRWRDRRVLQRVLLHQGKGVRRQQARHSVRRVQPASGKYTVGGRARVQAADQGHDVGEQGADEDVRRQQPGA